MEEAGGVRARLGDTYVSHPAKRFSYKDFDESNSKGFLTCTQSDFVRQNHEICAQGNCETLLDLRISTLSNPFFLTQHVRHCPRTGGRSGGVLWNEKRYLVRPVANSETIPPILVFVSGLQAPSKISSS